MTYDQWKTTPPDWMQEPDEPTPEQQEQEWFDEWFGLWLSDMDADGYLESLPDYPDGQVVGACICGSWPGGECLKCPPRSIQQTEAQRLK